MFTMQYKVRFGRDHEMASVRERIRARSAPYDDLPGLVFKAFMMQTLQGEGANTYSSYYVWRDVGAFSEFLEADDKFGALTTSFGRPDVAMRVVTDWIPSNDSGISAGDPAYAVQVSRPLAPGERLQDAQASMTAQIAPLAPLDMVFSVEGDPWRVHQFALLAKEPGQAALSALGHDVEGFEVVHVSRPAQTGDRKRSA